MAATNVLPPLASNGSLTATPPQQAKRKGAPVKRVGPLQRSLLVRSELKPGESPSGQNGTAPFPADVDPSRQATYRFSSEVYVIERIILIIIIIFCCFLIVAITIPFCTTCVLAFSKMGSTSLSSRFSTSSRSRGCNTSRPDRQPSFLDHSSNTTPRPWTNSRRD